MGSARERRLGKSSDNSYLTASGRFDKCYWMPKAVMAGSILYPDQRK